MPPTPDLQRRLGPFDATMIVMGGIVGSGIFMNPYVVAGKVHTPALILGAWVVGGVVALLGAFVFAELAARRPEVGGIYAYVREALHPSLAFVYGWGLLLVTLSGGMAAVAVTFARYLRELTGLAWPEPAIAAVALALLTVVNCLGARAGSATQNALMVTKLVAIVGLVLAGLFVAPAAPAVAAPLLDRPFGLPLITAFGATLAPVLFAYGGWQTAGFVAGEMRDPRRDLPRGLMLGVGGVVVLYLLVNWVCLRVLGTAGLEATRAPATDVMRAALGEPGARLIAAGIAVSTLGFLSQSMLTAPRVYYAMGRDGIFLSALGRVHPRTHAPVVAIVLQGVVAIVIALSGTYDQILAYVVATDWVFFALAALSLFVFRRRDGADTASFLTPGHPWTTGLFVLAAVAIVVGTAYKYPWDSLIGLAILAAGLPVYWLWRLLTWRPVPRT